MGSKLLIGTLLKAVAGLIDLIPMIWQGLTWDANLSAFSLWMVSGFMLAATTLRLPPVLKGMIIPLICLLPSAVIIGWKEPLALIPIGIITMILGSGLGLIYHRVVKE